MKVRDAAAAEERVAVAATWNRTAMGGSRIIMVGEVCSVIREYSSSRDEIEEDEVLLSYWICLLDFGSGFFARRDRVRSGAL